MRQARRRCRLHQNVTHSVECRSNQRGEGTDEKEQMKGSVIEDGKSVQSQVYWEQYNQTVRVGEIGGSME